MDTWGISGPTFLLWYVVALVAVGVLAAAHRKVLFGGSRHTSVAALGPQQVAYLNGGRRLALYSSLAGLRGAGVLGTSPDKTLAQTQRLPAGVTPLDTAVWNAAGHRLRARDLDKDQWVASALDQLQSGLEQSGHAVSPAQVKAARLWVFAPVALVVIGVARLIAGEINHKPTAFLFVLVFAATALALTMRKKNRWATEAAIKDMIKLRGQHSYLNPGQKPSYATYGATGAAMGVALFGAASLYDMDPSFAAEAEVQRQSVLGIGSSGSGSNFTSDNSGSSCSSGSSSCGGGGGCGGGGCGG
ncbi:TIGR04222 domain-containing membrane protein [Winogradskya consettensis]|uniref:TIGR04222 domain-containing membrane protein n=1 Tax=Winogradskya consettensis TaxID=113560 RepID=A0A919SYK4_9ACTN|nr:TIGR04222 domain-containing membrane protein [Actinoplanes consettensis]GIM81180.1 hypothetical protein Aco04nite_75270 [Actinoplanes consettensis]